MQSSLQECSKKNYESENNIETTLEHIQKLEILLAYSKNV